MRENMKVPTLKNCCCFDLRFGSLVIACLELAYAVMGFMDGVRLATTTTTADFATRTGGGSVDVQMDDLRMAVKDRQMAIGFGRRILRMYVWFHLAETVGILVIASLLVHGIRSRRASLFIPWLGIHFLSAVVFGILAFVVPLGAIVEFGSELAGPGIAAGVGLLAAFFINTYVMLVVYSYYRELRQQKMNQSQMVRGRPVEVEVFVDGVDSHRFPPPPSYDELDFTGIKKEMPMMMNPVGQPQQGAVGSG